MKTILLIVACYLTFFISNAQENSAKWVSVSPFSDEYNSNLIGSFISVDEGWLIQLAGKYNSDKIYYTTYDAETFKKIFHFNVSLSMFQSIQILNRKYVYATVLWENNYQPNNMINYIL